VGGDAVFGGAVHGQGPDLDLERDPLGADHRGMQGLVHIGLGHRDIVLEAAGHRLVQLMDQAQDSIAVGNRIDDDPGGEQVIDLFELLALGLHLAIDAVEMLGPAFDICFDAHLADLVLELDDDVFQILLPFGALL